MIISKIKARNVLKYAELSIDIAEQGLIAIRGENESGKSTIGETICFALFGRTFSITPDELHKIVRWGENHCDVTLEFSVADEKYVLSRFLDRDGNHSAKLAMAATPEEPVARGIRQVKDALFAKIGFAYEEFVESFYLAQREITTPHPHSQAVKIMAGVAPLEKVEQALHNEIGEREELRAEMAAEWEAVDRDVKALGIREGYLPELETQREGTAEQLEQVNGLIGGINTSVEGCVANNEAVYRASGAKSRAGFFRFVFLLLAIAAGALWGLLTYAPGLPQTAQVQDWLAQQVPRWSPEYLPLLGYAAAGAAVLFLLAWMRVAALRGRIGRLREESKSLAEVLGRAREIDVESIDIGNAEEEVGFSYQAGDLDAAVDNLPQRPEQQALETLTRLLDEGEVTSRMAREYCDQELAWLGHVASQFEAQLGDLDADIDQEQARLQEAMELAHVLKGISDRRDEVSERIEDRRRGLELLAGAITRLADEFNHDVKELVARMLPRFTDDSYEHLKISDDLSVRVFSNAKRDFMDLEEVSSGTQRQIMLALRLALSKKLLSRTVKGKQFAFLDEPFAFFDEGRTRRALGALSDLGDDVSQVWIVAQDFPEDCKVKFDTMVTCERNSDTIDLSS